MYDYNFETDINIKKKPEEFLIYVKKYIRPMTNKSNYVFLGAWNFKKEIFKKEHKFIKKGGKFITHIPFPKII